MDQTKEALKKKVCASYIQTTTVCTVQHIEPRNQVCARLHTGIGRLSVLCDVNEPEDMKVGRFIAGLREEIRRKVIVTPDLTLHSVGHLALEIEKNKRKGQPGHSYTRANRTYTPRTNVVANAPRRDALV